MKSTTVIRFLILLIPAVWVILRLMPANHPRMNTMRLAAQQTQESSFSRESETFATLESSFQAHYQSHYASSGFGYNHYRLAYKYGYDLARDPDNRKVNWNIVEPRARAQWDERTLGTWSQHREAVLYGWEQGMKFSGD
ncbi:MAG: hypothetical protein NNA20_11160 [Nitrospira sp.]|nr:hypothetical protein [Nitrospira sp.]